MHIPAHVLDPMTCAATGAISAAVVGYATYRAQRDSTDAKLPLVLLTGAGIFATQALNYPTIGGSSGHFLGGCLAAILLGPWAGILVMAAVIAVQALVLQDGGVDALGANILNMAVIGPWVGHAVYARVKGVLSERWGGMVAAIIAGWCSVMASAALCSLEISWGTDYSIVGMLTGMLSMHALIGLGEGFVTAVVLVAVAQQALAKCTWRTAMVGLMCVFLVAFALTPFACQLPDGLESCLSR
jgi:cobalt/nickel transport system permease protein